MIKVTDSGGAGQKNVSRDGAKNFDFFMSEVKYHQLTQVLHQLNEESTFKPLIDEIGSFLRKSILRPIWWKITYRKKFYDGPVPKIFSTFRLIVG